MALKAFIAGVLAVLAIPGWSASSSNSHADEIQAFALIKAIAQTASDRCADILVNNALLDSAPVFFHMTPGDAQNYRFVVRLEMDRLAASITGAPSIKAWCDTVYRAYGPNGDVVRGLLKR